MVEDGILLPWIREPPPAAGQAVGQAQEPHGGHQRHCHRPLSREFRDSECVLMGGASAGTSTAPWAWRASGCWRNSGGQSLYGDQQLLFAQGATTPDINQAETKRAMMKTANRVILLCDSTKFGHDSFMRFGEVTDFDVIVSDSGMSQELVKSSDQGSDHCKDDRDGMRFPCRWNSQRLSCAVGNYDFDQIKLIEEAVNYCY